MEGNCAWNQDKTVDYYETWPPLLGGEVGRKLVLGCGVNQTYFWGQVTSYPVTTCRSCSQY